LTVFVDRIYSAIVRVLTNAANAYVSAYRNFFSYSGGMKKLSILKEASVESNKLWKAAGKPRAGQIFDKRQSIVVSDIADALKNAKEIILKSIPMLFMRPQYIKIAQS